MAMIDTRVALSEPGVSQVAAMEIFRRAVPHGGDKLQFGPTLTIAVEGLLQDLARERQKLLVAEAEIERLRGDLEIVRRDRAAMARALAEVEDELRIARGREPVDVGAWK